MECDGKWCQLFLLLLFFFVRKETKEPSCDGFPVWPSIHRSWMAPPCNAAPHCASHKVGGLWRVSSHNFSSSSFIFFFFYSNIPFLLAAFRWNFQCHSNRPSIKTNLNRPGKARDSTINTRCRDFHQNLLARNFIFIFKKNNYRFIDYFFYRRIPHASSHRRCQFQSFLTKIKIQPPDVIVESEPSMNDFNFKKNSN